MSTPFDVLSEEETELLSDEGLPEWIDPMLATLVDDPFSDPDWIYERKLDGERCIAYCDGDEVRLMSRNEREITANYPELADALVSQSLHMQCVFDGEVVAFDGDVTSFQKLQPRMQVSTVQQARQSDVAVFLYLFDILHLDGSNLRDLPLRPRKEILRRTIELEDPLRFTPHRNENGEELYEDACASGWEGLIAKDATSGYEGKRSRDWLKFKCVGQQEFVVGGFTDPEGSRSEFGALLIGYNAGDSFVYAGMVGTGFDEGTLDRLGSQLRASEIDDSPFSAGKPPESAHWVDPEMVVEVGFTEWTDAGRLRHPRYLGLRRDKPAEDVVRETAS